mmetsp:Transcript_37627/g.64152  ORF Transcript_37627/g.64152 Transcript_37627/m.64152 type:complete len:270 (+) Transcript_37627:137-946(+)
MHIHHKPTTEQRNFPYNLASCAWDAVFGGICEGACSRTGGCGGTNAPPEAGFGLSGVGGGCAREFSSPKPAPSALPTVTAASTGTGEAENTPNGSVATSEPATEALSTGGVDGASAGAGGPSGADRSGANGAAGAEIGATGGGGVASGLASGIAARTGWSGVVASLRSEGLLVGVSSPCVSISNRSASPSGVSATKNLIASSSASFSSLSSSSLSPPPTQVVSSSSLPAGTNGVGEESADPPLMEDNEAVTVVAGSGVALSSSSTTPSS